jgi:acyl-CoA reductase-like NAD-dependent aldehyde dehydrogenase
MRPPPLHLLPDPGALIGDRVIQEGSGGEYEHVYAATGEPTKRVPLSGPHEVELATKAARDALPVWQALSSSDRRRLLLRAAELIRDDTDLLGTLTTVDSATPKAANDVAASWGADFLEYNAAWIDRLGGEVRPADQGRPMHAYTRDEPYGVVAAMTPFNAPIIATSMVLGPVLAAGNTIVIKPSHLAPFGILRLGKLFLEAGFPPGVVNIVPGSGKVAGDALVRSPAIDKVFFEGSTNTAEHVLVAAAESGPKPVALELGGKSPAIVYDDADLPAAVQSTIGGGFTMGGQGCVLGTRLLVQASIYDEFVDQAAELASSILVGDPFEENTAMGPVFNEVACERILDVISEAVDGAQGKIVAGGERLAGEFADGYFIAPTLFADVEPSAQIAREEIFGPVLCIMRFDDEAEALEISNDSPYGLGAYVYTNDVGRVHRMTEGLQSGMVYVNGSPAGGPSPGLPFGGVKHSGFGRLGGIEAIREFTRPKSVMIFL